MTRADYDIAIIGGGINGCGIARDAAGRGLSVLLVEQSDLAGATSSASSKLIHGGLRYLEQCAFRLVRESLKERDILLKIAPHLIRPLRFVLPHVSGMRPAWLIHAGLFLYDHLGGHRRLPRCRRLNLRQAAVGEPLQGIDKTIAFEYYDGWTNDARLVILNAQDAARRGADILSRTRCCRAVAHHNQWQLQLRQTPGGEVREVRARCLINATGPWAAQFLQQVQSPAGAAPAARLALRLVQGSHIIVPKLYEGAQAYVLQNEDGRIVFTIPYEEEWTLIGTTDRDFDGDPQNVAISEEEISYLQSTVKHYFGQTADTIAHHFCGVRPLADDDSVAAQKANRDYLLKLEFVGQAPLLNIYGGKLTTYRRLAESVLQQLYQARLFSAAPAWSAGEPLPGGDLAADGEEGIIAALTADARISTAHATRLARAYGTMAVNLPSANGEHWHCFDADLYAWEVDYLMRQEWAREADDVLWRRSALGLRFSSQSRAQLDTYMRQAAHA